MSIDRSSTIFFDFSSSFFSSSFISLRIFSISMFTSLSKHEIHFGRVAYLPCLFLNYAASLSLFVILGEEPDSVKDEKVLEFVPKS